MANGEEQLWMMLNEKIDLAKGSGQIEDALRVAESALQVAKRAFEPTSANMARALERLAEAERDAGANEAATVHFKEAMEILKGHEKVDQASVLRVASALAVLYEVGGMLEEAEKVYIIAVEIMNSGSVPADPFQRAMFLNNLAGLQRDMGKVEEAGQSYSLALEIYERLRGFEHPEVAIILNNIGVFYSQVGDLDKAEVMHLRALSVREKNFGPNHPDVGQSIGNLAVVYHSRSDYTKAAAYYEDALKIMEKQSSIDMPEYSIMTANYVELLKATGKKRKADAIESALEKLLKRR